MPASDLDLLKDAVRASGEISLGFWRKDPRVWQKGPNDPVSEADLAVDRYLADTLLAARPDYGWLSEETEDKGDRLGAERVFIADPIDGTRAFVKGEPAWCHAAAVVSGGTVTAAAVYFPAFDTLFAAALGHGATRDGTPIRVAARDEAAGARVLATRPSFDPGRWRVPPGDMTRGFRPSLIYRFCLVAEGKYDATLSFGSIWEWDVAPGALIAAEAGARVTDRRGAPFTFNRDPARTDGAIAAPPGLHGALLARMA